MFANARTRLFCIVVSLLLVTALLAGCGQQAAAPKPAEPAKPQWPEKIFISMAGPLTGDAANMGEMMKNGATLAVEEINAAGGIKGAKIEIVIFDDKADAKEAAVVAQKIAGDTRFVANIGHLYSSCTMAALPIYDSANLATISSSSSAPHVSQQGFKNFYRTIPHDQMQGPEMINQAIATFKAKKIAIIYANDDYGRGLLAAAEGEAQKRKAEVELVAKETYVPMTDKDFTPQLTKVRKANPDAILILGTYVEAGPIVRQMRSLGMKQVVMGAAGVQSSSFIELAGKSAEGAYVIGYWDPSNPSEQTQKFVKNFQAKFGKVPEEYAGYAYDIPYLIKQAIEKVGLDRAKVRDALRETTFNGPTGLTAFDEKGDQKSKRQVLLIVKDGKFVNAATR